MRDLVALQRVNKKWKAAITGYSVLRKALFLQPTEDIQLSLVETRQMQPHYCTSQWDCPPFVTSLRAVDMHPDSITRWAMDLSDEQEYRIVINPILGVETPWSQWYFYENFKTKDKFLDKAYQRSGASWKGMLFAQPPLKEMMVRHRGTNHVRVIRAKDKSKGLTLGDVHRSKRAFNASIERVWGEDGFSRGLPEESSAYDIVEKLGVDPAPETLEEADLDPDSDELERAMDYEFLFWVG
ncbi:hypothetical protein M409DRAFT_62316 [Zasmidium cellare ATCC 36951]|uniref:F-box domain-containing protein n=1 Tax=Zasmidium cellare ATCC 36951 TaxID=1080233 RepID=A0A6A6D4Z7_ZASCE|nr:uncharacterized protein M409DRAFT_62316 [Zasmidium cellare ATCC 36951]KAF2174203.1 hypothetical protein M409DRAFT_62316 [Zasmidium cellare ATCC 36951]